MITVFFIMTTIISSVGWLCYWVGGAALAKYMMDKGYTFPSDEELKECNTYVLKKIFHIH